MIQTVCISISPLMEKNKTYIEQEVKHKLLESKIDVNCHEIHLKLDRRSVDCRHGKTKIVLRYIVYIDENANDFSKKMPVWQNVKNAKDNVAIIGSGPAGLMASLKLLERGIKPIIFERGKMPTERLQDIAKISREKLVNPDSNYCFGLGGAGTFSDGKLKTRVKPKEAVDAVLRTLVFFGANTEILTDSNAHIGTDKLPRIIKNIIEFIQRNGGEFYSNYKLININCDNNRVKSLEFLCSNGNVETKVFNKVILATGHSATDIYLLLARLVPDSLQAKNFAIGVRVEHPRQLIDRQQYHGQKKLEAARYVLKTQVAGRGVYSFCMCPGGFVIPSSTSKDGLVVNGMSSAKRNSKWSNAAIVVETKMQDMPQDIIDKAELMGTKELALLLYRSYVENLTLNNGKQGVIAPSQRLDDFLNHRESIDLPITSYTPGVVSSRLDLWLPQYIKLALEKGFHIFNNMLHGYICHEALLIASETRTSSPIRILRDKNTLECIKLKGLYPAGEGSGYAGGIISSAIDGMRVASII